VAPEGDPLGNPAADDHGAPDRPPARVIIGYFEDGPNLVTMAMNG
jgi:hypothetical protein